MSIESDLGDISKICDPGREWWLRLPPEPLPKPDRDGLAAAFESVGVGSVDAGIEEWFTYINTSAVKEGPAIPVNGLTARSATMWHSYLGGYDIFTVESSLGQEEGGEFNYFSEEEKTSRHMAGLHIGHFITLGISHAADCDILACFGSDQVWLCHHEKSARTTRMNPGPEMELAEPLPGPTIAMWIGCLVEALKAGRLIYKKELAAYGHPDDDGSIIHPGTQYPWGWQPGDPFKQ